MEMSAMNFDPSHTWSSVCDVAFQPSPELIAWQRNMEELLWKQRQKGGVIDLSQSDVIDDTWVRETIQQFLFGAIIIQCLLVCRHACHNIKSVKKEMITHQSKVGKVSYSA